MAALGRAARLGYEAANRDDMEATFIFYHRDCESILPAELANMGDPAPRGREERVRWQRSWQAGWGGFRFEPEELIDLGVRQVVIGRVRGRGQSSGVAVDSEWAVLFTSRAGLVTREEIFMDHRKALEAAGLGE
jgi:ketosteroid isomerase-like protein